MVVSENSLQGGPNLEKDLIQRDQAAPLIGADSWRCGIERAVAGAESWALCLTSAAFSAAPFAEAGKG
jgi:hypothetical protein